MNIKRCFLLLVSVLLISGCSYTSGDENIVNSYMAAHPDIESMKFLPQILTDNIDCAGDSLFNNYTWYIVTMKDHTKYIVKFTTPDNTGKTTICYKDQI